jgi:hypothetical protein
MGVDAAMMMRSCLLSLLLMAPLAQAASLCTPDETTYFSCRIKGSQKMASLCGGDDVDGKGQQQSWLQYRFGKPKAIELAYPVSHAGSLKKFEGTYFGKYDYVSYLFINEKVLYEIELVEQANKKKLVVYGHIKVEVDHKTVDLACDGPVSHADYEAMQLLTVDTFHYTGDGKDSFLWRYHNVIAK